MSLQLLANTKYTRLVCSLREHAIHEEFGDTLTATQFAQVKMMFWNNEANMSLRFLPPDGSTPTVSLDLSDGTRPNQLIYDFGQIAIHIWSEDPGDGQEFGAHNFGILLKSKPASNVLNFSIKSKGLTFFKQTVAAGQAMNPPVTLDPNTINSYAVYYSKRGVDPNTGKVYATGKAFHISRKGAIDSTQQKVWCDQDITVDPVTGDGTLTITIPLAAYNNAVYPSLVV